MNVVLWVMQAVLAALFAFVGVGKLVRDKVRMREQLPWVEDFSQRTVRIIGVAELLGAVGLVVPGATGIAPWLTPLAAAGLAVLMVLAALTHVRRKEPQVLPVVLALGLVAAFVAWQRFGPHAF